MFPLVSKASDGSEPKRVSLVALQRRWQGQVHSAPTTAAVAGEIAPHGKPEDFVGTCRQGAGLRGIQSDVSLTLRTTFIGCVHILVDYHGAGLCPALGRAIGGKVLIFRPPGRVFGVVGLRLRNNREQTNCENTQKAGHLTIRHQTLLKGGSCRFQSTHTALSKALSNAGFQPSG